MAVILSPCLKSFIVALSSPVRARFRQLLYVCQTMLKAEIAKQVSMIGRNDVVVGYYKNAVDQLNNVLRPLESEMNLIPFSALQGCVEGTVLQGNLLMIYFQKKSLSLDLGYKIAQNGFVSAYANQQYSNFNAALAKITDVLLFMDDLGSLTINTGDHVRVYSTNQTGTIISSPVIDPTTHLVNVLLGGSPSPPTVQRPAGDIGRIA